MSASHREPPADKMSPPPKISTGALAPVATADSMLDVAGETAALTASRCDRRNLGLSRAFAKVFGRKERAFFRSFAAC